MKVRTGLERFASGEIRDLDGMRIGLLTNPCGIDRDLRSSIDIIHDLDFVKLVSLFGPEYGIRGEVQAGDHVETGVDTLSGLLVHSLYGETRTPTPAILEDIDALVVDLQDIGVRYATYLSTLDNILTACDEHRTSVVILDRPNPLGGEIVRGGVLHEPFRSFIGTHTLPVLHGMTLGELGRLLAAERGLTDPHVVPMAGWARSMFWDDTGLPWVLPSPNLPTLDSHLAYPATCLIEGTNLSEGRGTTRPFEIFGAPWIEPHLLSAAINELDMPGVRARPSYFVPTISKHAGQRCGGLQLFLERAALPSMPELGVRLLRILAEMYQDQFDWVAMPDDGSRFFIDLLTGSDDVRLTIDSGADPDDLLKRWENEAAEFIQRRKPFLLYDS